MIQSENENIPKDAIVDQLFGFIATDEHLSLSLRWVDSNAITKDEKSIYALKTTHKHTVLKTHFQNANHSYETKISAMEKIMGSDNSDIAIRCKAACMAGLPDAENKAKVWAEITDPSSQESLYVRGAKMSGFYCSDQLELISPYFEKYFEVLPMLNEKTTYKYLNQFFHAMLPITQIKDSYIVKLVALKNETPDSAKNFNSMLQDGIEILVRTMQIREFAKGHLAAKL